MRVKAINPLYLGSRPYPAGAILEVPNPLVKAINPLYLDKHYAPGDVVDITDALGQKWIDMGLVEKVEEKKTATKKTAAKKK